MIYFALIGDIKKSRTLEDRSRIQLHLKEVLSYINSAYRNDIEADFLITLGDEFQGLLKDCLPLLDILKLIQREMYPVEIRFGIGIGEITTGINKEAIGADGPAFYAARNMIEDIRRQEKKLKNKSPDIQIGFYNKKTTETEILNTMLFLIKNLESEWSLAKREALLDMLKNGGSQEECAVRLNTTQSTIQRRLFEGNFTLYQRSMNVLNEGFKALNSYVLETMQENNG